MGHKCPFMLTIVYVFWYFVLLILTQTHGCFRASWAVILLAGLMVNIWLMRFLASGVTVSHSGEGNYRKHGNSWVCIDCCTVWVKSQGDSRHKPQLWSVGRVCAGLHPKTEDIPPAEYTGWLLQSHSRYLTSNGFYGILCVLTIQKVLTQTFSHT